MENIITRPVVQLVTSDSHRFTAMAAAIEFADAGQRVLFVALKDKRITELLGEDDRAVRIDRGAVDASAHLIHCTSFKKGLEVQGEYDVIVLSANVSDQHRFLDVENFVKGDETTQNIPICIARSSVQAAPMTITRARQRGLADARDVGLSPEQGFNEEDIEHIRRCREIRADWSSQFTYTRTLDVDSLVEDYRSDDAALRIRVAAHRIFGASLRGSKLDKVFSDLGLHLTDTELADERVQRKMLYQTILCLRQPDSAKLTQISELHSEHEGLDTKFVFVFQRRRLYTRALALAAIMRQVGIYEDWIRLNPIIIDQATGVAIKDYVRAHPDVTQVLTGYGFTEKNLTNTSHRSALKIAEAFLEHVGYIRAEATRLRSNGEDRLRLLMVPTDSHKVVANSNERKYTDSTPNETPLSESGVITANIYLLAVLPPLNPTALKPSMELDRIRIFPPTAVSPKTIDDGVEIPAFYADKHLWDTTPPVLKQDGHDDQREASYRAIQKSIDDMGVIHLPNPKYREAKALDPKGRRYSYFRWDFTNQKGVKFNAMVQSISKSHRGLLRALPGRTIINFDMKQCHFRIAARLAAPFDGQGQFRNYVNQDDFYQHMADDIGVTRSVAKTCALSLLNGAGPGKLVQEYKISHKEAYAIHKGFNTKARSWNTWRSEVNKQDPLPFRWDKKSKCMSAVRDHTRGALELQVVERRILDAFLDAIREKIPALRLLVSIYDGAVWDIATTDLDLIEQAKTLIVDTFKDTANQQGYPELQATVGSGASWGAAEGK